MAFIREVPSEPIIREHFNGGAGYLKDFTILKGKDEMHGKGRVFSKFVLETGCEVGLHVHHGDCETIYITNGHGKTKIDGEIKEVGPGTVYFIEDGDEHWMINDSEDPLEFVALVLYTD